MKTAQEVFDTVAAHLLKQGVRSMNDEGLCLYRGPNGTKCAVGILIPDEVYSARMEEKHVYDVVAEFSCSLSELDEHLRLLNILQSVHDTCKPENWPIRLKELAIMKNLEFKHEQASPI